MSNSPSPIEHGYLVLADISGYTSFLTQTELDHAHEILTDLLETILKRIRTLLAICKLEGDAVFAYSSESLITRGKTLLELIEATYTDFRERMKNVRRHTTCTCRACQSIPLLDLKFMIHHGDFVIQNISGVRELAGPDVNLVHRLLKNHVAEKAGWRAYALFTEKSLEHMGLQLEGLMEGSESYEHLGEIKTYTMDMHVRYAALMEKRHAVVEQNQAFLMFTEDFKVAPPVVWNWLNEPEKRQLYAVDPEKLRFRPILRPGGRTGVGATTHCVHGKDIAMRETVLDWKPFEYYTVEQNSGPLGVIQVTFKLEALDGDKTRLHVRLKGSMPKWPAFLNRFVIRFVYTKIFDYQQVATKMKEVMEKQTAETSADTSLSEPVPVIADQMHWK